VSEPRRIHLLTLGCPKNQVDSEVMLGVLARRGHELVFDPEAADVLVVNTCSFIQPAKEESIDAILDMARVKAGRPGRRLVVPPPWRITAGYCATEEGKGATRRGCIVVSKTICPVLGRTR